MDLLSNLCYRSVCVLLVGACTGPVFDRGYLRLLLLIGSFGVVFGFMMLSLCKEFWQAMLAQGFPEGFVTGYLLLQAEAVGRRAPVTHTIEEILGRPATDFATWAADSAESFRRMAA